MRQQAIILLATFVATFVLAAPLAAHAGCVSKGEVRQVRRSLSRAMQCNFKHLRRGPDARCNAAPAPACAGSLVTDAVALAYGRNDPAPVAVDRQALRDQLRCQKQLGRAVVGYVGSRLQSLVRGRPAGQTAKRALRKLVPLERRCGVAAQQDGSGVWVPDVGPQCAAAFDDAGTSADPAVLQSCLATLLDVWTDRNGPDPQPLRPNIVLILTDDQRWDTVDGTHSPSGAFIMPYTHAALGAGGATFTNAFLTTPLCCPSRASILAGQYAHRTGVYSNTGINGGADDFDDTSTMGLWLQEAGYRTGFYGKYMNGYRNLWDPAVDPPYVPPGWTEWRAFERVRFFDYNIVAKSEDGPVSLVPYGSAETDYSTDVLRKLAVEFIESTPTEQPFFLYLNFKAPHLPRTPAPRHDQTFQHFPPWRPPSHNEPDVSDKPLWLQATPLIEGADLLTLDRTRRRQLEMLQAVDEAVDGPEIFDTKSIMQALRDRGIADDTIVIFFSDNGWMWGEHRLDRKSKPYEEAIRSPMLVRYPRLAPLPREEARFALNIDLAPTLVELAGAMVSPPLAQDGMSLVRVLDATAPAWRTDFLTEGWPPNREWATVREEQWKYTELPVTPGDPGTVFETELYDLWTDPYELVNVADDPAHAMRIMGMSLRLRELRPNWPLDSAGDTEDPEE